MFDLSFFELIVIGVVGLLVIGPEKLPKVARMLGALTGRAQRYVAQVKEEINREDRFSELQALQAEIKAGVDQTKAAMQSEVSEATAAFSTVEKAAKPDQTPPKRAAAKPKAKKKSTAAKKRIYEDELVQPRQAESANSESVDSTPSQEPPAKKPTRRKRAVKSTAAKTVATGSTSASNTEK